MATWFLWHCLLHKLLAYAPAFSHGGSPCVARTFLSTIWQSDRTTCGLKLQQIAEIIRAIHHFDYFFSQGRLLTVPNELILNLHPMKVALVTDGIWPYVLGGMQKHSFYLCKYLAAKGVNIDLIHFNQSNYDIKKLEVFTEEEKRYINSVIIDFPESKKWPGHYVIASYLHSKKIFDYLNKQLNEYDFIYTKGFTGWYLLKQKNLGRIKCCPVGVKFHGYEMFQKQPDFLTALKSMLLLRYPVIKINKMADVVFSYGGKITGIIESIGVPQNKIIEIPSGVEENTVSETITENTSKPIRFLYLGRYERRKGIEELNEAIHFLLNGNIEFEFHFIGPIPEEKKISHKQIVYHGEIRDKTVLNSKIRQCDVLVCPSYSEGFPNVILEAMSNGLTVAATPVGAVELLVNKNTGWIIEESNAKTVQHVLENILVSKREDIFNKKTAALQLIKKQFTWNIIIEKLLQFIRK